MKILLTYQGNITIRRANRADVARLLHICRKCFPDDILYQGVRWHGENWWQVAVMSEAADTYVVERDAQVAAFAVLVKNEELWKKGRKQRHSPLVIRLLSRLVCPRLAAAEIRRNVNKLINRTEKCLRKPPAIRSYNRTWLELLAVLPEERGHGIAKQLLQECESHTKAMGREAIGLMVPTSNLPAIRLYEQMGYKKTAKIPEYEFYVKVLDSTLTHGEVPAPQE